MKQLFVLILVANFTLLHAENQFNSKSRYDKIIIKKYDSKGKCISKEKIKGSRSFESVSSDNSSDIKWFYQGKEVKLVDGEFYYPNGKQVKIHYKRKVKYYC